MIDANGTTSTNGAAPANGADPTNRADATLADRIASRGRDALVERLRKAYADAAASHADIVSLEADRIEALVQSAANRADGLQWRRALASVATEELGIGLAEALTHPAVRDAQQQLGAPSYETSLAELVARPLPPPLPPEPPLAPEPTLTPEPTPIEDESDKIGSYEPALGSTADQAEQYVGEPTQAHALEDVIPTHGDEHTDYPPPADAHVQVPAYHVGGVANLPTGREGLGLRLSDDGLDILQPDGDIIGRLHWNEIDMLEVIAVRGRLRRRARTLSRIVVRTKHGDASFEIPGVACDDLQARIEPLVSRYASA